MTRLRKNEVVFALGSIFPRTTFDSAGGLDAAGSPLRGSSGIPNRTMYVPSAFGVWVVSEDLRIGVGLNAPFGEESKYNEGWIGRYYVTNAKMKTANLSGTLAWRISPVVSIGGGLDYQRANLKLNTAIDFGSACFGAIGPAGCAGLGVLPQTQDGSVNFDVSSNAVGFNLGILIEPNDRLRLGAAYRSSMTHNFSGTAVFTVPAATAFLTAGGSFRSTRASTQITLPEMVTLGAAMEVSPQFTLLAGLIWSRASRFDNLVVRFDNPAQPTVVQPQNWKNTYRASVGFDYRLRAALIVHGGVAYDQSPIPTQFRYPYLPGSDSVSINTGLPWKPSDNVSLTVSYSHAEFKDASISQASPSAGTLTGTFKRDFNTLGLQTGYQF